MNTHPDLDRSIAAWLVAEAPDRAPARLVAASQARIAATEQRRIWIGPWRGPVNVRSWRLDTWLTLGAGVVLIALVAGTFAGRGRASVAAPTAPAVSSSGLATPTPRSMPPRDGPMPAGRYLLTWSHGPTDARISVTVPDGWRLGDVGLVYKNAGYLYGFPVDMGLDDVTRLATSVCALDDATGEVGPVREVVGPSVDDLVTAISSIGGTHWFIEDATIAGYHGKRLETRYEPDCPGPSRRDLWGDDRSEFFLEEGVRSAIYVIDVDGDRLVVSTHERTNAQSDRAELEAVIESIGIEPGQPGQGPGNATPPPPGADRFPLAVGPDAELRLGRHRAIVDGIPFTFAVPTSGWEPQAGFYVSKDTSGSQAAEATLRWTGFPSAYADACSRTLDETSLARAGAKTIAEAVATAPGLELVSGPKAMIIDGRSTWSVEVTVAHDSGCDPGYFYSYDAPIGGALWTATRPNDTIYVWIVDLDGRILFIEGEQRAPSGEPARSQIQSMVESMRFE